MLINSVTMNRVEYGINKIVTTRGKYKGTEFIMEQFFRDGKQVERHMQVIKDNYIRNNVKVLGKDGKFQSWG
jgi:hypothetical protein